MTDFYNGTITGVPNLKFNLGYASYSFGNWSDLKLDLSQTLGDYQATNPTFSDGNVVTPDITNITFYDSNNTIIEESVPPTTTPSTTQSSTRSTTFTSSPTSSLSSTESSTQTSTLTSSASSTQSTISTTVITPTIVPSTTPTTVSTVITPTTVPSTTPTTVSSSPTTTSSGPTTKEAPSGLSIILILEGDYSALTESQKDAIKQDIRLQVEDVAGPYSIKYIILGQGNIEASIIFYDNVTMSVYNDVGDRLESTSSFAGFKTITVVSESKSTPASESNDWVIPVIVVGSIIVLILSLSLFINGKKRNYRY